MYTVNFDLNCPIKSYQYYAYPAGIIFCSKQPDYLLTKFLNIFYDTSLQFDEKEFVNWDYFKCNELSIPNGKIAVDFIIQSLMENRVVQLYNLNIRHLSNIKIADKQDDFLHDILIIGFENGHTLLAVGYTRPLCFEKTTIEFSELYEAIVETSGARAFCFGDMIPVKVDYDLILNGMKAYAQSRRIDNVFDGTCSEHNTWGIAAFNKMIIEKEKDFYSRWSIHDICLLNEHKILTELRMKFLVHNNRFSNEAYQEYQGIMRTFTQIKLAFIRNTIYNSGLNIYEIIKKLKQLYETECNFWKHVVF